MSIIALVSAGAMGANVGRKFVDAGFIVLTNLEGRSESTRKRAHEAGMIDASWADIVLKADIVMSVIPPRDAISFAERLLKEFNSVKRVNKDPLIFADCNAVNVVTIKSIASLFVETPITFLDGCIIGGPPSGNYVPTFYASADPTRARELNQFEEAVKQSGIKARVLSGDGAGIGDASALKMSYAGISKGLTGLFTTIILAAHANSPATSAALLQELSDSQPELLERITRAVPAMIPKAYRWVGEMEEIAGFVGGGEGNIYHGLSKIYARIEQSIKEDQTVATTIPTQKHDTPSQTPPSSATKLVNPSLSRQPSTSSNKSKKITKQSSRQSTLKTPTRTTFAPQDGDEATWGSNFWVTLVDPQTATSFFACPATGQVSWDPPVGTFVLPPSLEGEWWELSDESRGGLPYYYQTKTGETVWERPSGFVIPLGILQNTAMGRRLSQTTFDHFSKLIPGSNNKDTAQENDKSPTKSPSQANGNTGKSSVRKSSSGDPTSNYYSSVSKRHNVISVQLTPIPGSPNATDESYSPSLASKQSIISNTDDNAGKLTVPKISDSPGRRSQNTEQSRPPDSTSRARPKAYTSHRPPPPQSLHAALEFLTTSNISDNGVQDDSTNAASSLHGYGSSSDEVPATPSKKQNRDIPPSPSRPIPEAPKHQPTVGGKGISGPILNHAATMQMSPVKNRSTSKPIIVEPSNRSLIPGASVATLQSGTFPILPHALASDIQQFSESDYAKQYFSTHRTGFIFKRRVPVAQLMTWQRLPLTSPLLVLNRALSRDAVKVFKVIQHIMGDREREKPVNVRYNSENQVSVVNSINASTTSLSTYAVSILEEERWLISEGLKHGELRDEIYCQLMKQLTGNSSKESVFKGWQLLCVLLISFPPSKNFEAYLQAFVQKHTTQQEGRVDVMAKHCLRRLVSISKKGPRGKPPSIAEIETASDAAFNPSTFGESLDATIRLQERNYPHQKIPIILPFLADGILALGGTKAEGIFRVPGDNDSVSALKLRIDRGYYTLEGVDDPHVLASLMKLWLRELCDPLVPEELYNECIQNSKDPEACVQIVERLPTINRRVVLFVISFLQIFLEERTQSVTKMTPANLALVMAPNLLRCNSESMSVVFTNAQYEQIFVYNLLLHLQCDELDNQYKPVHGLGAVANVSPPKKPRNRSRRPEQ
ncbi:hypothetical protein CVT25_011069 [Psilocybe cyanescens]|uniref:Rho-GAP domain-containing protein n=1 Tax=Psilocybe cyanescens TaxID=93625 RepID=A0A409WFG5_PSICY|nr:hypothetical protein CVT25_011069 [Psilocybe cyanescens]